MVNLASVSNRFEVPFTVVEGGSGVVMGVVSEADQNSAPNYIFTPPRLIFRVKNQPLFSEGKVIQSPEGQHYLVGYNGPSIGLWNSYRLFLATSQLTWKRREKRLDPVTTLEQDVGLQTQGSIWAAIEPIDREVLDRKIHSSFETARFICAADIKSDDILDGRTVTRSDVQLGLHVGTLV